ncbi:MAG TPA: hypothetical protein VH796_02220 [Nitrososphaeraceae archaeon]|jgi:hypothetical protein
MKSSSSNLQTIVLLSVLSGILLFGLVSSLYNGYHTQIVNAKEHEKNEYRSVGENKDSTNSVSSQTQQQQQSIPGAIQLSAKELPSGYRWIDTTNGVINPTMNFMVGNSKTIQLNNPTDATHQLVVDDPNGHQLATSGDIPSGSSNHLAFKPGMTGTFEYHCIYHPTTMKGVIHVQ